MELESKAPVWLDLMRAILYGRVSTDEQADKGYSLPTQLEACRKYAAENGFSVVAEFADDFTGAVPIEARPEGRKAYTMLRNGEADVLIAYRIDRVVRPPEDGDEWDMPILIRGLAKLGKELHTCNRGKLQTDFASLLIAMLDARKAGEERRDIIERSTRGRNRKAREGLVVGSGRPPYGYTYTDGKLLVIEEEAAIVRMIYRWYTVGDDSDPENMEPLVDNAITIKLSRMGIPTPHQKYASTIRRRKPGMWQPSTVRSILVNETYAGVWHYRKSAGRHGFASLRPVSEQIPVNVTRIVSREVWQAAQEQREHNKKMSKRNAKRDYLLRRMVTCGECGYPVSGTINVRGLMYYRCNLRTKRLTSLGEAACSQRFVRIELLDSIVWGHVMTVMNDGAVFEEGLRSAQDAEQSTLQPKRERLELVGELIERCAAEARGLAATLASTKAGGIMSAALQERVAYIEDQHSALQRERAELEQALMTQALTDDDIARAMRLRAEIVAGMENPTPADKRRVLEFLRVAVVVSDGKARVSCRLPVAEGVFDLKAS